jgi:hypothetical protein
MNRSLLSVLIIGQHVGRLGVSHRKKAEVMSGWPENVRFWRTAKVRG